MFKNDTPVYIYISPCVCVFRKYAASHGAISTKPGIQNDS